jgi:hypothetical protein
MVLSDYDHKCFKFAGTNQGVGLSLGTKQMSKRDRHLRKRAFAYLMSGAASAAISLALADPRWWSPAR